MFFKPKNFIQLPFTITLKEQRKTSTFPTINIPKPKIPEIVEKIQAFLNFQKEMARSIPKRMLNFCPHNSELRTAVQPRARSYFEFLYDQNSKTSKKNLCNFILDYIRPYDPKWSCATCFFRKKRKNSVFCSTKCKNKWKSQDWDSQKTTINKMTEINAAEMFELYGASPKTVRQFTYLQKKRIRLLGSHKKFIFN